ncbi:ROK family protein [Ruminococcus sp. OA3]|uniref:ROK family protein n=1 Tax=Ruminococcus sp. OA3 TaxID=2914164 RepID=UPI001F067798|nr:ROK family protein [Ruminococcus sp. OA3]MCH1981919.1 ROK family protein [Ruminococcus sp. OA3]
MRLKSISELKNFNTERIREAIQGKKIFTKSMIFRDTSLSMATCGNTINDMIENGEVIQVDREELQMGRPVARFTYNRDYLHVMGASVFTENHKYTAKIVITDALGDTLNHRCCDYEEFNYEDLLQLLSEELQMDPLIKGIEIGVPGVINGDMLEKCDIQSLAGLKLGRMIEEELHVTVQVKNDMDYMAYGAYHTKSEKRGNLAALYFPHDSKGIVGCGFVIDGRVLKGFSNFAGELYAIPEAFGISRQQQANAWKCRDDFLKYAAAMILTVVASINPEEIIIMGSNVQDGELSWIKNYCAGIIPEKHMVNISIDDKYKETYSSGLIKSALNRLLFPVSEV